MNNIGDKQLIISNIEDITSFKILKVDDVYEISLRESIFECTLLQFKYNDKYKYFKN